MYNIKPNTVSHTVTELYQPVLKASETRCYTANRVRLTLTQSNHLLPRHAAGTSEGSLCKMPLIDSSRTLCTCRACGFLHQKFTKLYVVMRSKMFGSDEQPSKLYNFLKSISMLKTVLRKRQYADKATRLAWCVVLSSAFDFSQVSRFYFVTS